MVPSTVRNTVQPTKGPINISKDTVAGGKTYKVPGTNRTYRYDRDNYGQYRSQYGMGYPPVGTATYFLLLNDPFYYPNYVIPGSPWFGHPMPVGYRVSNGQLIGSSGGGFPWGKFLLILLFVGAAIAAGVYMYQRSRDMREDTPYDL